MNGPDPIDVFVGSRLSNLRRVKKVSQGKLAQHLGISFQQVQKYEKGHNRIAASTLWRIAEFLDVPVSFFFDGAAKAA